MARLSPWSRHGLLLPSLLLSSPMSSVPLGPPSAACRAVCIHDSLWADPLYSHPCQPCCLRLASGASPWLMGPHSEPPPAHTLARGTRGPRWGHKSGGLPSRQDINGACALQTCSLGQAGAGLCELCLPASACRAPLPLLLGSCLRHPAPPHLSYLGHSILNFQVHSDSGVHLVGCFSGTRTLRDGGVVSATTHRPLLWGGRPGGCPTTGSAW